MPDSVLIRSGACCYIPDNYAIKTTHADNEYYSKMAATSCWWEQQPGTVLSWSMLHRRAQQPVQLKRETTSSSASPTAISLSLHYSRTNIVSAAKLHLLLWKSSLASKAWFSWARKIEILGRPSHVRQKAVTSARGNMAPPQLCLIGARRA